MKKNLGEIDRMLRIFLGWAIMFAGIYFNTWWGIVGGIIFLTSIFAFCPIYFSMGINSKESTQH